MKKPKTPSELYLERQLKEIDATRKMDAELNKFGKRTPAGGMVWTVGDLQRYFRRKK